ncbi:MAG TPA: hypothetical protein DIU15_16040 [Deltaproteobacteria bacterium]|nr:hypothetical protein [Deltaproteobacteria bacterium]HCP47552.1 hypothetical protein [Deltaproteobacteria bacterium]|tara:strand:+ start:338 stop:1135 length:798 start_codon:yes stop_codon:yes gene_type:complete
MEGLAGEIIEGLFRWVHVVAGVLWIGILYFFNWVNGPFAATLDAETKQKAMPELLPRALYFFRWGAAFTWITGIGLLGIVYYMQDVMFDGAPNSSNGAALGISFALAIIIGPMIYDLLWKSGLAKNQTVGVIVSFVLLVAAMAGMHYGLGLGGRALFIHVGALFGTSMAMNVWMRIWPAQRKIIAAIKAGEAPDADLKGLAGLRSKHNTYMSVPLIFIMVSSHYPLLFGFGDGQGWILLAGFIAVSWWLCNMIYKHSKGAAPAQY